MNVAAATRAAFIPDIQGSVIASVDSSSGALSKIGYSPYGKSGAASGPFGYTGQRIDPETSGLYYYRARHYSPAWGRFMQPDPIGYIGGNHLYAYVGNDPLNLVDPFGLRDSPWGVSPSSSSQSDSSFATPETSTTPAASNPGPVVPVASSNTPQSNTDLPIQLAAVDDPQRLGRPPIEGGGGGGGGGGFSRGGSPPISGQDSGPPASSFSGSLRNPLQAPIGPPRNLPGEFNGQPYTGHAFDALQNRGIPPSVVDQAINRGIPNPGNTPGTTRFYDPINNMSVVRDNATGNIITVRPGN